jgi:hypothetical protein
VWDREGRCGEVRTRAVPTAIMGGGGGGVYRVLPDGFLLKAIVFTVCEHEYMAFSVLV